MEGKGRGKSAAWAMVKSMGLIEGEGQGAPKQDGAAASSAAFEPPARQSETDLEQEHPAKKQNTGTKNYSKQKYDRQYEFKVRTMERRMQKIESPSSESWMTWLSLKRGGRDMDDDKKMFLQEYTESGRFNFVKASKWSRRNFRETLQRDKNFKLYAVIVRDLGNDVQAAKNVCEWAVSNKQYYFDDVSKRWMFMHAEGLKVQEALTKDQGYETLWKTQEHKTSSLENLGEPVPARPLPIPDAMPLSSTDTTSALASLGPLALTDLTEDWLPAALSSHMSMPPTPVGSAGSVTPTIAPGPISSPLVGAASSVTPTLAPGPISFPLVGSASSVTPTLAPGTPPPAPCVSKSTWGSPWSQDSAWTWSSWSWPSHGVEEPYQDTLVDETKNTSWPWDPHGLDEPDQNTLVEDKKTNLAIQKKEDLPAEVQDEHQDSEEDDEFEDTLVLETKSLLCRFEKQNDERLDGFHDAVLDKLDTYKSDPHEKNAGPLRQENAIARAVIDVLSHVDTQ